MSKRSGARKTDAGWHSIEWDSVCTHTADGDVRCNTRRWDDVTSSQTSGHLAQSPGARGTARDSTLSAPFELYCYCTARSVHRVHAYRAHAAEQDRTCACRAPAVRSPHAHV
eukprot:2482527-Prymnesium_polylepis.1